MAFDLHSGGELPPGMSPADKKHYCGSSSSEAISQFGRGKQDEHTGCLDLLRTNSLSNGHSDFSEKSLAGPLASTFPPKLHAPGCPQWSLSPNKSLLPASTTVRKDIWSQLGIQVPNLIRKGCRIFCGSAARVHVQTEKHVLTLARHDRSTVSTRSGYRWPFSTSDG